MSVSKTYWIRSSRYQPDADLDFLRRAYILGQKVHQGRAASRGEPYLVHPIEVAGILADLKLDYALWPATPARYRRGHRHHGGADSRIFRDEVAEIVDNLTKIARIGFKTRKSSRRRISAR
jgi:GTP pyrophosphokinase